MRCCVPLFVLLATLATACSTPPPPVGHYRITLRDETPDVVQVALTLPPRHAPITLDLRGLPERTLRRSLLESVTCDDDTQLTPDPKGGWVVPPTCEVVRWVVRAEDAQAGTEASSQRVVWHPQGWWLLPTPAWRLRPTTGAVPDKLQVAGVEVVDVLHGLEANQDVLTLAPQGRPPVFLGVRWPHRRITEVEGITLVHAFDDDRVDLDAVVGAHQEGFRHLLQVLGDTHQPVQRLLVFWLGLSTNARTLGGAAGHRSMLVNYLVDGDETPLRKRIPLIILLHEQFHTLVRAAWPLWMHESLAQYYGIRSALASGLFTAGEAVMLERQMLDAPAPPMRLLEAQQRVYAEGDPGAYAVFYLRGAQFWSQVDEALRKTSGGEYTLDDALQVLLRTPFPDENALPRGFFEALRASDSDTIRALIDTHVRVSSTL